MSRKVTRRIIRTLVSFSAAAATNRVIENSRSEDESTLEKAQIVVGSAVLGYVVGGLAADYVDKKIDEIFPTEETN